VIIAPKSSWCLRAVSQNSGTPLMFCSSSFLDSTSFFGSAAFASSFFSSTNSSGFGSALPLTMSCLLSISG